MVNDKGETFLINFDCAKLDASGRQEKKSTEVALLQNMFKGSYPEPEPSVPTPERLSSGAGSGSEDGGSGSETE